MPEPSAAYKGRELKMHAKGKRPRSVDEVIKQLDPERRKKVEHRAAQLIAEEHKAQAARNKRNTVKS